jgi:hypothetical protein
VSSKGFRAPRVATGLLALVAVTLAGADTGEEQLPPTGVDVPPSRGPYGVSVGSSSDPGPGPLAPLANCGTTVLPNDTSTSTQGRAPSIRYRGIKGVYLLTPAELAAAALPNGASPTGIGWRYSATPGLVRSGTLKVYLQNTSDTAYAKGASFTGALSGMTLVHNALTSLPNTTNPFDIAFSGGSSFTYTGGGLYVAFDWSYASGTLSSTAAIACNAALSNGMMSSQSPPTIPSDALTASNLRPETRLTVAIDNDVSVDNVLTVGQFAMGVSPPQVVKAYISNRGNARSNVPVTLTISGSETFTDTQIVPSLAACGGQATVAFAPFAPGVLGTDTVTVSVPADDIAANDARSRTLQVTANRASYKYPGTTSSGGVGINDGTGELVARFGVTAATQVDAVTLEFPNAAPGGTFRIVIRDDGSGAPGAALYTDPADRNVIAGTTTYRLPVPVAVGPGDFYVGVEQTSTTNIGLAFDFESPLRAGEFFLSVGGGPFGDLALQNIYKLNIGVTLGACLVPLSVDVTPDAAVACAGTPVVLTAGATGGTGALTYQWTENGSNIAGETGSSAVVTKPAAGSFAYNVRVSDDGGCIAVGDAAATTVQWNGDGGACDDGNNCTAPDTCTGALCSGPNPCDDADACTTEVCDGQGACIGHVPVNCDDGNSCTDDSCSPASGCAHAHRTGPCTDGDVCTLGDTCIDGVCVTGTIPLPSPLHVCNTGGLTIPTSGPATPYPSTITLSGQRPYLCSVVIELLGLTHGFPDDLDVLVAKAGPNAIVMSDAGGSFDVNPVNLALNDAGAGNLPDAGPLSTGVYKPSNYTGSGTETWPAPAPAPLGGSALSIFKGSDPDGTWSLFVVDDEAPDGGSITSWCVNIVSICTANPDCDDGNGCTDDACVNGQCAYTANNATCSDGSACTIGDVCSGGACVPGSPVICDDGDVCTNQACNPQTGACQYAPVVCNDGNPCTDDACVGPGTGCVATPNDTLTCSDGNPCTQTDACIGGVCTGSNPIVCNDANPCTTDGCDPGSGLCVYQDNTNPCDDGTVCTVGDVCGPRLGQSFDQGSSIPAGWTSSVVTGIPGDVPWRIVANSSDTPPHSVFAENYSHVSDMTLDAPPAAIQTGAATLRFRQRFAFQAGADGGVLELSIGGGPFMDIVAAGGSFVSGGYTGTIASASSPIQGRLAWTGNSAGYPAYMTTIILLPASAAGQPVVLRWRVVSDAAVAASGQNVDSIVLTDPRNTCIPGPALSCDDGNPCRDDSCDPQTGCLHADNTAPCSDGNACTSGDTCGGGSCQPGGPTNCDDGNPCTDDSCDAQAGCLHANNVSACSDGNACTDGDTCSAGACQPGGAVSCADGDACTLDTCVPQSGCSFPPRSCNDFNVCTDDSCDPQTGCLHAENTLPCDDFNLCTSGDVCGLAQCNSGPAVNCDDGDACTIDSCDPDLGCLHAPVVCFDDGNSCTDDVCTQTGCTYVPRTGACSDGNACTNGDVCTDGFCAPGPPLNCDDGDACTVDNCEAAPGCVYAPVMCAPDGNPCTNDVCTQAGCTFQAVTCDDGNACTDDACDPETGGCLHTNNSGACNDGNACTTGDSCSEGLCVPGGSLSCDDANACTTDACSPATGCVNTPAACIDGNPCTDDGCDPGTGACSFTNNTGPCSDGNACTSGEVCSAGICVPGAPVGCDDQDPCTTDTCDPQSGCVHTPTACDDGNPCTDDACDSGSGSCVFTNNTAPCDDGNACTTGDACAAGSCQPGTPVVCNDGNVCTDDACDPGTGACVTTNNTAPCSDGSACTNGDSCADGSCQPGAPVACSDGNVCTSDACDPGTGACSFTNNTAPCSDGNACTNGDACAAGSCQPGTPTVCNDGNACTSDTCQPATGCVFTNAPGSCSDGNACTTGDTCSGGTCLPGGPVSCNDANPCTTDACSPATGCVYTPIACSDGNACTDDGCDPGTGGCVFTPRVCDDGNVCTSDACQPATGCVVTNNTAPCDDGNACTTGDVCSAGACVPGGPANCDDSDPCTTDTCDAPAGCLHTPLLCSDGNACTDDACDPGTGACAFVNNTAPCSDGSACTTGDACAGGSCQPGTPTVCDDGNACTDDACDPGTGACAFVNNTAPCSDGNACTSGDACASGVCQPGQALNCDDGDACTVDTCDGQTGCGHAPVVCADDANSCTVDTCTQTGCIYVPRTGACDDGNACTNGDACTDGFCQPGPALNCDDGDACTVDTCDGQAGCLHAPVVCFDDGNPCTDDVCTQTGCIYVPRTGSCSDGNACTNGDVCTDGFCAPGPPLNCDDGDACTVDTCGAVNGCDHAPVVCAPDGNDCTDDVCTQTGCVHVDNSAACDDGDPCTGAGVCAGGSCGPGPPAVPPETAGLVATSETTYAWTPTLHAIRYDVVRGRVAALPAGPGAGDEICFADLPGPSLEDTALPPVGTAFWYLIRPEGACFGGTFGNQSNGTPRSTTTCP